MTQPEPVPAIRLRGVRHNNLKNFDLDLPLGRLIVITGLSGSGKSSLAFDTLFAEGQRRYIETFSPYARQFFDRMDKPRVDRIEGIPPAIAIEQRNTVRSTRSTVGTMTELCDYMKLLWPHLARLHCRQCGQPVRREPPQLIWESQISDLQSEILITFDLPLSEKLSLTDSLALLAKQGYQRLLVNGEIVRVDEAAAHSSFAIRHSSLTVVQDRLTPAPSQRARFVEACEHAYHFGKGRLAVHCLERAANAASFVIRQSSVFSNRMHCAACDLEYREPSPALFSFNHPIGACPTCKGFGRTITIDYDLAIPDRTRTLAGGCVKPWQVGHGLESQRDLMTFCKASDIPVNVPFAQLAPSVQDWVINGDADYGQDEEHEWPRAWYGVKGYFRWLESKSYKMHVRVLLSRYRAYATCPACAGRRFQPDALLYRIPNDEFPMTNGGELASGEMPSFVIRHSSFTLADFYQLPVDDALAFIESIATRHSFKPNDPLTLALNEVRSRLRYLVEVGLGYLTLDRPTRTLSGGETERVNLTTCLGTRLVNTLFVLDEPSVGLHPRDTARLVRILENLRDTGNTVVVVEHEASVMRAADQLVDIGPASGEAGGQVVFQGTFGEMIESDRSLTGQYLSGRKRIEIPARRSVQLAAADAGEGKVISRSVISNQSDGRSTPTPAATDSLNTGSLITAPRLRITNAARHNLKNLTVEIPLNRFVCLTGVSGSGKTTLVREVLLPALEAKLKSSASNLKASDRMDADNNSDADADSPSAIRHSSLVTGWESLAQVVLVDQSPLGKTPRSNPVVYIGAFEDVREIFAQTELAKQRGLNASAFSFNSAQGQCERCRGAGFEKIEMQFLSDVFIRCPECDGRRYRGHILEVKLRGARTGRVISESGISNQSNVQPTPKRAATDSLITDSLITEEWSIADMLEATVDDAVEFLRSFSEIPAGRRALASLRLLQEVGLGYLRLGQPINTLSGGESQRLKLVSHLAEAANDECRMTNGPAVGNRVDSPSATLPSSFRPALFLFDEPTTGLHFDDVRVLLKVFQRLVDAGHSVVVIEHNLDVIKCADWVLDLGPEAGERGGHLVAAGTPEDVARCEASHTGRFLRELVAADVRRLTSSGTSKRNTRKESQSLLTSAATGAITIHGAREHNLKNLSLEIPRGKFVVVTGVSGSGKSTLAFDLLFAEGQRRFLDSMNTYARQFVEQLARPDVDLITGLPPTVSIEQRTTRGGGKSTVATVTEVYHFLRLLFARLGTQFCPDCQLPVEAQTRDALAAGLKREIQKRGPLTLLAPVVRNRKGFHTDVAEWAAKHGYREIRADGKVLSTGKRLRLDRFREHDVEIKVGLLDRKSFRVAHPLIAETLKLGQGTLFALDKADRLTIHSTERACPKCSRSFAPLDPKVFSYNSAQGWCPKCRGFGELFYLPDVDRGADADSIEESWWSWQEGKREVCPDCDGARLNAVARAVRLRLSNSKSPISNSAPTIDDFSALAVASASDFFRKLKFKGRAALIARDILPEICERLKFLDDVGLGYLQLGRGVTTLSGGEAQRIRLAAQLGSNLSGVLYVLDEPTIGLHARDNEQLLAALHQLQARGNSLIVVEHDEETMRRADYIIDLGPGAGTHGGQLVAGGTLAELMKHEDSITGQCLRAQQTKKHPARGERRPVPMASSRPKKSAASAAPFLTLHHASANNLKNFTVRFPLNRLVVVTGVSGSGKSTLVRECLLPAVTAAVKSKARSAKRETENKTRVTGYESLKAVYEVDQSPIGRTPRSTPATYVGFFDEIRALFAQTTEARMRGYTASRFSFNSAQGRCPECEGTGNIKLEMNFLPPAFVRCETCGGTRFGRETLDIEYNGRNVAQVLELSVEEAIAFFASHKKILRPLQALHDTGLDYLKLGQTSPTLSGGEAQRVKLVTHLLTGLKEHLDLPDPRAPKQKRNLFILEEPTIGLHISDVCRLVEVLQRLVDAGHSVIVIEHNLDLIAEADWVIDLGPEAGADGGQVVAAGSPEQVAKNRISHTGRFLRQTLKKTVEG